MYTPSIHRSEKPLQPSYAQLSPSIINEPEKLTVSQLKRYLKEGGDVHVRNKTRQTLLHLAAQAGDIEKMTCLLEAGAHLEAEDETGSTPLFAAVMLGHSLAVQWLISRGAAVSSRNHCDEIPLDVAIRCGHDDIVHMFLGTLKRLDKTAIPHSRDLEKFDELCLQKASKEGLCEEQIYYLLKLCRHYLNKKNLVTATLIVNSALAIWKKVKPSSINPKRDFIEAYLWSELAKMEKLSLESLIGPRSMHPELQDRGGRKIQERRAYLSQIRENAEDKLKKEMPSDQIVNYLTLGFKVLFQRLLNEAIDSLGPPPGKWACLGMGSMARGEMCPYSDVEFAFLVDKEVPRVMQYFRNLSRLLQVMFINMGETSFPVLGPHQPSPTPNGYCMDTGGNVPLGGLFELIGTPVKLSTLQSKEWIDKSVILANVMSNVCLIGGDEALFSSYGREMLHQQNQKDRKGIPHHEHLAWTLLSGHLEEFAPNLSKEKESLKAFGIKKELYRPIQEIVNSLAILYKAKSNNTFERIDELECMQVFSDMGVENIKTALRKALELRLEAHFFYRDEQEYLCHRDESKADDPSLLYMQKKHVEALKQIYAFLDPFHRAAKEFYRTKLKNTLSDYTFHPIGLEFKGYILDLCDQYQMAYKAKQQNLSLNPSVESLMQISSLERRLEESQSAFEHTVQALKKAKAMYGDNHLTVADCYCNIGNYFDQRGKIREALRAYRKALKIALGSSDAKGQMRAGYYYLLIAMDLLDLNMKEKAVQAYQQSCAILEGSYQKEPQALLIYYQGLADICYMLDDIPKALHWLQEALKIHKSDAENSSQLALAEIYKSASLYYRILKKYDAAWKFIKKALALNLNVFNKNNVNLLESYLAVGDLYHSQEKYRQAISFYCRSLNIARKAYGQKHSLVGRILNKIARSLYLKQDIPNALKFGSSALRIMRTALAEEKSIEFVNIYYLLAACFQRQGEDANYCKVYRKIIQTRADFLGKDDHSLADDHYDLGLAYRKAGKKQEALFHLMRAFVIFKKHLKSPHPKLTLCRLYMDKVRYS